MVISHFGPLGRLSLDTKHLTGATTRCGSQSGQDLTFELPGHVLVRSSRRVHPSVSCRVHPAQSRRETNLSRPF